MYLSQYDNFILFVNIYNLIYDLFIFLSLFKDFIMIVKATSPICRQDIILLTFIFSLLYFSYGIHVIILWEI